MSIIPDVHETSWSIDAGQDGFTYMALLFAIVLAGTALAATGVLWRTEGAREREAELLFIGGEIQRALESYFLATPIEPRRYPRTLEELVEDRRGPFVRRHLRRLYADPLTGKPDWMLVRAPDGTITGVHSTSELVPIKRASAFGTFPFADAKTYRDWLFAARSGAQLAAASVPGGAPAVAGLGAGVSSPVAASPSPPGTVADTTPQRLQTVVIAPAAEKPKEPPPPEKPPQPNCLAQRANDGKVCQGLRGAENFEAAGQCLISASQRYVACESGQNVSPLRMR